MLEYRTFITCLHRHRTQNSDVTFTATTTKIPPPGPLSLYVLRITWIQKFPCQRDIRRPQCLLDAAASLCQTSPSCPALGHLRILSPGNYTAEKTMYNINIQRTQ